MFCAIYKATIKNLLRSKTFWLVFVTSLLLIMYNEMQWHNGGYTEAYGFITDTDPRFSITYSFVYERIENIINATLMFFMMPLFSVISTIIILKRDYEDNFYEIEKAASIKPFMYIFSRILVLIVVNFIVVIFFSLFAIHFFVAIRGSEVKFLGIWYYLIKTFTRTTTLVLTEVMPCLIAYITFTVALGAIFRSSTKATILSIACIVSDCIYAIILQYRFPSFVFENIAPVPFDVRGFMSYYGTINFESYIKKNGYKFSDVILYVALYIVLSVIYLLISCIRQRKREM